MEAPRETFGIRFAGAGAEEQKQKQDHSQLDSSRGSLVVD
jgi:hypothetical protein